MTDLFPLAFEGRCLDVPSELDAVRNLQTSEGGRLRIAAALSICTYFLPDVLREYQTLNPKVVISLRSGNSLQVLKMVLDGEVDIGIARSLHHPEVETMTLREDPLVLVGSAEHPLAQRKRVTMYELESWPLIFYDRGASDYTLSQGLFRRSGLLPNTVLEVESIEAAKRLVEKRLSSHPVVVVSAMGKTTNELIAIATAAANDRKSEAFERLSLLRAFHRDAARPLMDEHHLRELETLIDDHFNGLAGTVTDGIPCYRTLKTEKLALVGLMTYHAKETS